MACIEGDGNGTCSNFSRRCLRGPHNLKFKLKFCFYLRQRLTSPILTSGVGGGVGGGVTPLLLICKLVCGSIRIVSAGGNQMTPVVAVFGSVSYFSLRRCYGASRNTLEMFCRTKVSARQRFVSLQMVHTGRL